jgi:hypothetical protein
MTSFKLCSAALIAVAMLTTSAEARVISAPARSVVQIHHASAAAADHWLQGRARVPAWANEWPQERPGAVCDHGDDPEVC